MIALNGTQINFTNFPNGETLVDGKQIESLVKYEFLNEIDFKYKEDSDLIKLMFVKKHLDSLDAISYLVMYYMPYSRMDRVEEGSVFTLKYVSQFINSLNFEEVLIIEPHSDVTPALIDKCFIGNSTVELTYEIIKEIGFDKEKDYIFFPDSGASKRYGKYFKGFRTLVGHKERDFETGDIKRLNILGEMEKDRKVVIVDDICSKGGTFLLSARKLTVMGAKEIYLVVSHCEETIYEGEILDSGYFTKIYATNSIIDESKHETLVIR